MERWRRWGLSEDEWNECVEAAHELALIADAPHMSAEEIAAQLAVAKAAEQPAAPSGDTRRLRPL